MPAQRVARTSFATEMRMPPTPKRFSLSIPVKLISRVPKKTYPDLQCQESSTCQHFSLLCSRCSYLASVRDYDIVNIVLSTPFLQTLLHSPNVRNIQKAPHRFPKEPREVLDGVAFCWRIDHTKHLFEVILDQLYSRMTISIYQGHHTIQP